MLHVEQLRQPAHNKAFRPAGLRLLAPSKWAFNRKQMNLSRLIIPQPETRAVEGGGQPRDSGFVAQLSPVLLTPPCAW